MTIKPQSGDNKKIQNHSIEVAPQLRINLQKLGLTTIGGLAKASPQKVSAVTGLNISQAVELCRSEQTRYK